MKIALVMTTIHVPRVLELYHAHGKPWRMIPHDFHMFIAGDECPANRSIEEFCSSFSSVTYLSPAHQRDLNYKCSPLLGWNTLARRNIATLEALKWGADIIVFVDDDNIPIDCLYFNHFHEILIQPFFGLKATTGSGWFDVGVLLDPPASHRGFPFEHSLCSQPHFKSIANAKVGVAAGIVLGDPDISAITRIARAPTVHQISRVLDGGVITDPSEITTVFNSQNTAFIRELAPCMFMSPVLGRYDDIVASLICQRIMRERDLHVHFGNPFVWQQRNHHNLTKDLEAEMWGTKNLLAVADWLDRISISPAETPLENMSRICAGDDAVDFFGVPNYFASLNAWLDDCEKVM